MRAFPRCRCGPQVPHYVAQPPSPKATLALLRGVEDILDAPMPLGDLPEESRAWERGVDELAQQDSEVADYVRTLEEAKDAMDLPEASGDAIAREFERYFRRHGGAGESMGPGGICPDGPAGPDPRTLDRGPGDSGPVRRRIRVHAVLEQGLDPDPGGVDLARGQQSG